MVQINVSPLGQLKLATTMSEYPFPDEWKFITVDDGDLQTFQFREGVVRRIRRNFKTRLPSAPEKDSHMPMLVYGTDRCIAVEIYLPTINNADGNIPILEDVN